MTVNFRAAELFVFVARKAAGALARRVAKRGVVRGADRNTGRGLNPAKLNEEQRKQETVRRLREFREELIKQFPVDELEELFGKHTCLYAVGSTGRMETDSGRPLPNRTCRHKQNALNWWYSMNRIYL